MSEFINEYSDIWGDDPRKLLDEYHYQERLTEELDKLKPEDLDKEKVYEIVLWKLNRFPEIDDELIKEIALLASLDKGEHEKSKEVLKKLLSCRGVALPMASTFLRFINPNVFQIIDDRAYRVLLPGEQKYPTKPTKVTESYLNNSIKIYFQYLKKLRKVCGEKLPFREADRILYQLDIKMGNKVGT